MGHDGALKRVENEQRKANIPAPVAKKKAVGKKAKKNKALAKEALEGGEV